MSLQCSLHFTKNLQHTLIFSLLILTVQLQSQNGSILSEVARPLSCGVQITSYPYTESFETGLGDWIQETTDDFDWTRWIGATGSSATGPSNASDGVRYMYGEASNPNYPNKVAILISPCFDLTSINNPIFTFDYHMYGATMGTLDLQVSADGIIWTSLWSLSGDQGNLWRNNIVNLTAYSSTTVQLKFIGETSSGYRSDFAIDNILLDGHTSCTAGISVFPYTESFETGLGVWTQGTSDDFDWSRWIGATGSSATGPSNASDGVRYMYTESSSPNYPNKTSVLTGPCFDLTNLENAVFEFDYHMYGSSMGTLDFQVSLSNGANWSSVWSLSGDQGNLWRRATIDLSAYYGGSIQLRFVGTTLSSYRSDMAIDDLALSGTILLPVELVSFYGTKSEINHHKLYWQTASEINNSHFIVERSIDAVHFERIGQIEGNGNSNEINNYDFIVDQPLFGVNYYRLKQVDFDGTTDYSKIVHINHSDSLLKNLTVYPNPANNKISLRGLIGFNNTNAFIKVLDMQGKVLFNQRYISSEGDSAELTIESLTKGYYLIVVTSENIVSTIDFIKQ